MSSILEIDQELAKRMLVEGGTLVFLNVPKGTEFGIDLKSWNTDENFKGMKMIPPGLHYVFYSSVSKHGEASPRVGFFHNFSKSEFLVRKWDEKEEDISLEDVTPEEIARLKSNFLNLDKHLGPYPFDIWKKWKNLSEFITVPLVTRLSPESGLVRSALDLHASPETSSGSKKRRRTKDKEEDLLPQLTPTPGTALRVTKVPEEQWPEGASPAEVTRHSMDSSYALQTLLATYQNPTDLVGEMQLCYVCFLVGHSLEAFEQWKSLLLLICSSEDALARQRAVFSNFITAVGLQLEEIPEDFLVDVVAGQNAVYQALRKFFSNLKDSGETVDARLKSQAERLRLRLETKFGWGFNADEEEDDDEAPVVVDLDEDLL